MTLKHWGWGIAGISVLLISTACNRGGSSVPTTSAKPPKVEEFGDLKTVKVTSLLPTTEGAQATYEAVGTGAGELTIRVKKVVDSGDSKIVTLEFVDKGNIQDFSDWQISDKGIYQLSARKGIKYEPPKIEVPADLTDQTEKKYNGKGPFPSIDKGDTASGPIEALTKIRGIETVDTAMGQIEALAVQGAYKYKTGGKDYIQQTTTWYSPKYGIVRYVQSLQRSDGAQQSFGLKLKGFSSK